MGHYHCVIPIDWDVWCNNFVPAWTDLLTKKITLDEYIKKQIPFIDPSSEDIYYDKREIMPMQNLYLDFYPEEIKEIWHHLTPAYITSIGWNGQSPFLRSSLLRNNELHRHLDEVGICDCLVAFFYAALKRTAGFIFDKRTYAHFKATGYYATLGPLCIGGAKNRFRFLEEVFDRGYLQQHKAKKYKVENNIAPHTADILANLFASRRTLPGIPLPSKYYLPSFGNGFTFHGIITPEEVKRLAAGLSQLEKHLAKEQYLLGSDVSELIRYSAKYNVGLVTLGDGFDEY